MHRFAAKLVTIRVGHHEQARDTRQAAAIAKEAQRTWAAEASTRFNQLSEPWSFISQFGG